LAKQLVLVAQIILKLSNSLLAVIKYIYLLPTYLHFIQDIEDRCLLLTSSMSYVDLPFQEHRMMRKHQVSIVYHDHFAIVTWFGTHIIVH
jgi:hypothetical protein